MHTQFSNLNIQGNHNTSLPGKQLPPIQNDKYTQYAHKTQQQYSMNPNHVMGNNNFNLNRMTVPNEFKAPRTDLSNMVGFDAQGGTIPMNPNMQNFTSYQPYENSFNSQFANNFMITNPQNTGVSVNRFMENTYVQRGQNYNGNLTKVRQLLFLIFNMKRI